MLSTMTVRRWRDSVKACSAALRSSVARWANRLSYSTDWWRARRYNSATTLMKTPMPQSADIPVRSNGLTAAGPWIGAGLRPYVAADKNVQGHQDLNAFISARCDSATARREG